MLWEWRKIEICFQHRALTDNKNEYRGTQNPIGFYVRENDFDNNIIQLNENDNIYLFSDGYTDQFGGEKN